jgi:hypothetical protein
MRHLGTVQKNSREEISIDLEEFRGFEIINIRVWFEADDGEMRPSKKGLAFRRELLPEILAALGQVEAVE